MTKHATLSASSSHRWLKCPPSALLEREFPDTTSSAAEEGTAAHAMAEHKLNFHLHHKSVYQPSIYDNEEMEGYTDDYVAFVIEQIQNAKESCSDPLVLLEERLDFTEYVPDGFGTGDCVIISDDKLQIIDLKYGLGVLVEAEENPQMMLYALGALATYGVLYDIKEVSMTIFQPRRENISTWTISVEELCRWAEEVVKPTAQLAIQGKGDFHPGSHCTFCKAKVQCRARAEANLKLAQMEFQKAPLLEDSEIEEVLAIINDLTKWAGEVQTYALDMAINRGKEWTGYKLVAGRSVRKYANEEQVAQTAIAHGYEDIYKKSLIGLTEMTKLMGKKQFDEILGELIIKPQGKPSLVPVSDKRKAIQVNNVKNEFNEIKEGI
ncbi:DUF2800 domain-containing protein [Lactococcus garvieae]|uniref:DUF2800 domain-containing protein n=1 Tax=Lactococcus garvieae TaxID=1363 RepID=UPI003854CB51